MNVKPSIAKENKNIFKFFLKPFSYIRQSFNFHNNLEAIPFFFNVNYFDTLSLLLNADRIHQMKIPRGVKFKKETTQ